MKAMAIPIEVLVIVVVAVIVLLGIVAVYFSGWSPYASTTGAEGVKTVACRQLVFGHNCGVDPDQISVFGLEGVSNLQELCDNYFGSGGDPEACKYVCGCGGVISIGTGGPSWPTATCGDGIMTPPEDCDIGSDLIPGTGDDVDSACPGLCQANCECPSGLPCNWIVIDCSIDNCTSGGPYYHFQVCGPTGCTGTCLDIYSDPQNEGKEYCPPIPSNIC